jgi:predicted SAM-dependent methyltransferase
MESAEDLPRFGIRYPLSVHVGCGQRRLGGWLNIDSRLLPGVDRVLDVRASLPLKYAAFLYAEHFLEHLTLDEGIRFLLEYREVLLPEGGLRLSTPNLEWVIRTHYRAGQDLDEPEGVFDCVRTNQASHGWGHRFLYNRAMVRPALAAAGFAQISFHAYGKNARPEFAGIEGHEKSDDVPGLPHVVIAEASGSAPPTPLPEEPVRFYREALAVR